MLFFKNLLLHALKYKFSILTFLGIWFLIVYPSSNYLNIPFLISAGCLLCIVRIISISRYYYIFAFLLAFVATANAVVCVLYKGYFTFGIFASIMETNPNEASGAFKNLAITSAILLTVANVLIILSCKEFRVSRLSKKSLSFI